MMRFAIALAALVLAGPAYAKVHESSESGFVLRHGLEVPASPMDSWKMLVTPPEWWSEEHSFSGDVANLSLDPRAGGCFCEVLPSRISPNAAPRGSVEHMRVIYAEEPRALRMSGALGPLQSGSGTGTLTIFLRPSGEGTRILWEYVYGGYLRGNAKALAATIDAMLAQQVIRLGKRLGASPPSKAAAPDAATASGASETGTSRREDDFARQMAGALEESPEAEAPNTIQPAKTPNEFPPRKNERVFIGR